MQAHRNDRAGEEELGFRRQVLEKVKWKDPASERSRQFLWSGRRELGTRLAQLFVRLGDGTEKSHTQPSKA